MSEPISRRDALKHLGVVGAGLALHGTTLRGRFQDIVVAGQPVELTVASLSPSTVRLTLRPLQGGRPDPVPFTGALAEDDPGDAVARGRDGARVRRRKGRRPGGALHRRPARDPRGDPGRRDGAAPDPGRSENRAFPSFFPMVRSWGLGEGGEQFDRKGTWDRMRNGQVTEDNYSLAIHGTRMPVQWLVGTDGWGMFIHQPYGAFDFRAGKGSSPPGRTRPFRWTCSW